MAENIGKVIQISGPAVDVQFDEATMPPIYQALRVISEGFSRLTRTRCRSKL